MQADSGATLRAIDYKSGKTVWRHDYPGGGGLSGLLSTAGKLLFSGDGAQHLVAFDPANGKILWHAGISGECEQWTGNFPARRQAIPNRRGRRLPLRIYIGRVTSVAGPGNNR